MKNKQLTTFEASCIIAGYGIGSGVLSIPLLVQKNGLILSAVLFTVAYIASWILHIMIADVINQSGTDGQINSVFSEFLFTGKMKKPLTLIFFAFIAFISLINLSVYMIGSSEIIAEFLHLPQFVSTLIFYFAAAIVVFFGLKAVGISEKYAVSSIAVIIGLLSVSSLFVPLHNLPLESGTISDALSFFSISMLSLSAFFSVSQVWNGLNGDMKKVKKAITLGLSYNSVIIILVTVSSLLASDNVTEVCLIGWCSALGTWAEAVGGLFTIIAMLTTYWSLSFSLSDTVKSQFGLNRIICWAVSTIPSLILVLMNLSGFLDFLQLSSGICAMAVIVLFIPTFIISKRKVSQSSIGVFGSVPCVIFVAVAYIITAIGSIL